MRSVKEILANEKFQADKKNDFAFEGLVLTGFLHLPGIKKSLQCVVKVFCRRQKEVMQMSKLLNVIINMITVILIIGIPAMLGALLGAAIGWLIWLW